MRLSTRLRGKVWRVRGMLDGREIRLSLGTYDPSAAAKIVREIELALIDGKESNRWPSLKRLLPDQTFKFFASLAGWNESLQPASPTWLELLRHFMAHFRRKILRRDRSESTRRRYDVTLGTFSEFLASCEITRLADISHRVVEEYKSQRLKSILARKHSRGGSGLHLDIAILHSVFKFAIENRLLAGRNNPVKFEKYPGKDPQTSLQPFKAEELARLRQAAGPDLLAFLVLRHTGLRGFDASDLRWAEVDLRKRMVVRQTRKLGKKVWIPIHAELLFALELESSLRQPALADHVLLNPATGKPMTRQRLYHRMVALGERAGVRRTHPHRFRDTLAIDLLLKGSTAYDAARVLGNTVAIVEQRYAPYITELREQVRWLMESPDGIETQEMDSTEVAHATQLKARVQ